MLSFSSILQIILLTIAIIGYFVSDLSYSNGLLALALIIMGLSILVFAFRKEPYNKLKFNLFRPIIVFIVSFIIVHFQQYMDLLLGNIPMQKVSLFTCKSAFSALSGLVSFFLGYQFLTRINVRKKINYDIPNVSFLPLLSVLVGLLALILIFYRDYFLSASYGIQNDLGVLPYIELSMQSIVFMCFVLKSYQLRNHQNFSLVKYFLSFGPVFWVVIVTYWALVLISGDRGVVIYSSICFLGSYYIGLQRRMSMPLVSILLISASLVITSLGYIRGMDKDLPFTEKVMKALTFNPDERAYHVYTSFCPSTQELSGSIRCLEYAVSYVPEHMDYFMGHFKLFEIFNAVPTGGRIYMLLTPFPSYKWGMTPNFFTWIDQGDNPYSGIGSTIIADIYVDFGLIGILVMMFGFGCFVRRIEVYGFCYSNRQIPIWSYVSSIVLLATIIYLPRATMLTSLRFILWTYVLIVIYLKINKVNLKNK